MNAPLLARMKNLNYALWAAGLFLLAACSMSSDGDSLLPQANGEAGEIVLVMESNKWEGSLGQEIRDIFRAPYPGLLQDEPKFNIIHIDPNEFNSVLKNAKNIMFVHSFEGTSRADQILSNYFTAESKQRIKNEPDLFMYRQKNLFAKNQQVLYLFQQTTEALLAHIRKDPQPLLEFFNSAEKGRFHRALYNAPSVKGIEDKLLKDHDLFLKIPYGYQIAIETDNTIWLRRMDRKIDKNIFITYANYTSERSFDTPQIVKFRDRKWRRFILGEDSLSYMVTEPLVPIDSFSTNIGKKYSVETRGVWKLNNNSMGGPFLGYTFVDQSLNRLYYIEGFVYSPGERKRNTLRELETVLNTFQTAEEYQNQAGS